MLKEYDSFLSSKNNLVLEETISNPNFSIVVPGGCNAKCEFCFYKDSKVCESYIDKLTETMEDMPSQFYQLSLTGGEPTLSPHLESIINSIDTERWTHTVLTTNGTKLDKFIPILEGKIKYVNISRHHYNDEINESVFKTNSVPNSEQLKELTKKLQEKGISVTYSAVITEHLDNKEEIEKYIEFAKEHGVNDVFFRKQHGTLDPSDAEKSFEEIDSDTHNCPVCRNTKQVINESNITWKASLEEPSKELGMIYEVVYNEDGTLSKDWEKEFVIDPLLIKENIYVDSDTMLLESCGGGSYSGCGGSSGGFSSCGGGYTGCGSSGSYYEEDEFEKNLKKRIKKNKERNKKLDKIKKRIDDRRSKQERKFKDFTNESVLLKYNNFIKK